MIRNNNKIQIKKSAPGAFFDLYLPLPRYLKFGTKTLDKPHKTVIL